MDTIADVLNRYETDKQRDHNYGHLYNCLFGSYRDQVRAVLEVGVQNGGSLLALAEIFPNAKICGIDKECSPETMMLETDRIKIVEGDATDVESLLVCGNWLKMKCDVIIDDGSHMPHEQIETARILYQGLADRSWYIIEDIYPSMFGPGLIEWIGSLTYAGYNGINRYSSIMIHPPLCVMSMVPEDERAK